MKSKKAVKKLNKVEALLSSIIDEYEIGEDARLREALTSAKQSVRLAQKTVNNATGAKTARKPAAKADAAKDVKATRGGRKVRVAAAG